MTENDVKRSLTAPELLFAKLRYDDKLNNEEIVKKCNISVKTGDRWFKKLEIQEEIARLGKADTEKAQRILERASVKAAEKLERLVETEILDPPLAETGRKAACDILDAVNVTTKTLEGRGFTVKVISHIPGE